jgi:hypothetical protein
MKNSSAFSRSIWAWVALVVAIGNWVLAMKDPEAFYTFFSGPLIAVVSAILSGSGIFKAIKELSDPTRDGKAASALALVLNLCCLVASLAVVGFVVLLFYGYGSHF